MIQAVKSFLTAFSLLEKYLPRKSTLIRTKNRRDREIIIEETIRVTVDQRKLVYKYQIPLSKMWVKRSKPLARILLEQNRT